PAVLAGAPCGVPALGRLAALSRSDRPGLERDGAQPAGRDHGLLPLAFPGAGQPALPPYLGRPGEQPRRVAAGPDHLLAENPGGRPGAFAARVPGAWPHGRDVSFRLRGGGGALLRGWDGHYRGGRAERLCAVLGPPDRRGTRRPQPPERGAGLA